MENQNSCNSLPYIDDALTDDETNPYQYNLKIIENYHKKNRNIEITNRFSDDSVNSLNPVAPLADESEFSDNRLSDSPEEDTCKNLRKLTAKESGVKLVIKGWNSSISIQGLDKKSSITFNRRCEKLHKKVEKSEERKNKSIGDETKSAEKSRKGRWKMLTRSIMLAKTARFERRGLDERYPKYVLLKNEEESVSKVKENYPKMFIFNERSLKQKRNLEPKTEFSLKKSFKNKTKPIIPLEGILAQTEKDKLDSTKPELEEAATKQKKLLTERNTATKKKVIVERRKSVIGEKKAGQPTRREPTITACPLFHGQVHSEIRDIFENALKLSPPDVEMQQAEENQKEAQTRVEYYSSVPPQFCQFSCHDSYCCLGSRNEPPKYIPVYAPRKEHSYTSSSAHTKPQYTHQNQEVLAEEMHSSDAEVSLGNLPFGLLSSFFPRVVIMKTIQSDDLRGEEETSSATNDAEFRNCQLLKTQESGVERKEDDPRPSESLEVPQDLTVQSEAVQERAASEMKAASASADRAASEAEMEAFFPSDASLKELPSPDDDQKTKSQGSETTEYLHYSEFDPPGNESVDRPNSTTSSPRYSGLKREDKTLSPVDKFKIRDADESSENLSLTKIGYKMYDNLTKLSLNREKEMTKKAEMSGCGCNGNETKKSPYNITLESNNSVVKVTVPENELNFQIVNSEGGDIQIGLMSRGKGKEEKEGDKKIVRKEELWHPDDGRRAMVLHSDRSHESDGSGKAFQKFKVSLTDNKEVVLSVEMNEKQKAEEKITEKLTKEMKVGTDDFDLAGGDFACAFGGSSKNLSPRVGQLLKYLQQKLETDEKERKFLDEKINQKLLDQKFHGGVLPGMFLVKHVSPRLPAIKKPESSFKKPKKGSDSREGAGQLREYYCEECLATMRIFEDENPSVKSMVDKFETIIQLESY